MSKIKPKYIEYDTNTLEDDNGILKIKNPQSTLIFNASNYASIQDALNAAETAGGGIVTVDEGTHNITATLQIASHTKLVGLGNVIIKRMANINSMIINKADGVTGGYSANTNMVIENITFDVNNTTYTGACTAVSFGHSNNVTIKNCNVLDLNTGWHHIELNGCQSVYVEGCYLQHNGTSEAIQLDLAVNDIAFPWFGPYDNTTNDLIFIKNCKIVASTWGIGIGNHSFVAGYTHKRVEISGCYFEGCEHAINLQDVNDFTIKDNHFFNNRYAISQANQSNNVSDWHILNNFCDGNNITGENRFFSSNVLGTLNSLENNNFTISGNTVSNCKYHGIAGTFGKNINITNNIVYGSGRNGIYFFGGTNAVISNNNLYDNYKDDATRADIVVGNGSVISKNVSVRGNTLYKTLLGTNVSNVVIDNNIIDGSAYEGTFTPQIGGATTKGTATYNVQTGYFKRIGNVVFVDFKIGFTAMSGGSGLLKIHNLPFETEMVNVGIMNVLASGSTLFPNASTNGYQLWNADGMIVTNSSTLGGVSYATVSTQHYIYVTGFYFVD